VLPVRLLHRHVGMGGDKFVAAVAGDEVEERYGDDLRDRWERLFDDVIDEIAPFEGAHALVADLAARGHPPVLASSAVEKHVDHYLDLLDVRDVTAGWTTNDDVEASKPEPDLVRAALDKAGTDKAVMVGDTPWDVEAARRARLQTICVISGGFCEDELREAGCIAVYESVEELRLDLANTPLS
jgi:HAD superfamily hydrolase (TIGR01549 family)